MIPTAVVNRYANALADAVMSPASGLLPDRAAREAAAREATDQLRAFNAVYQSSADLRSVLASPAISAARKQAVIKDIAKALGVSVIVRNFVLVLSNHRRAAAFQQVLDGFEAALDARLGFVRAEVRAAVELSAQQKDALAAVLGSFAGAKVRMQFRIDPDLIGGVAARIGSKVYDGSVRGQLAGLRERLVANL